MESAAMTSTVVNSSVKKSKRMRNARYGKFVVECNDDGADIIIDDDVVVVLQAGFPAGVASAAISLHDQLTSSNPHFPSLGLPPSYDTQTR
jgi:hypothetical protein